MNNAHFSPLELIIKKLFDLYLKKYKDNSSTLTIFDYRDQSQKITESQRPRPSLPFAGPLLSLGVLQ
jgi:hypothetical protein